MRIRITWQVLLIVGILAIGAGVLATLGYLDLGKLAEAWKIIAPTE